MLFRTQALKAHQLFASTERNLVKELFSRHTVKHRSFVSFGSTKSSGTMSSPCCSGGSCGPAKVKPATFDASTVQQSVEEYYGKVLNTTKDLKTSACTASAAPPKIIRDAISKIPSEVTEKFYGCGSPIPTGIDGLTVLDLGSGSGRDCYVAASLVGEKGQVIGLDMTDEQLLVARKHAESYCTKVLKYAKPNLRFVKGYIENIREAGIPDNSVDLVISNCVINLSPAKEKVIKGIYDALAPGGELYFSDVYCDRRLNEELRSHKVLWGECISGALYIEDFKRICHNVGFLDVRLCEMSPIQVDDPELRLLLGEAKFFSITFRCFKLPSLETLCEDYGQAAKYLGTIPGQEYSFTLDEGHKFEKGRWLQVCGNTASMLQETRLAKHFQVIGDRNTHYGRFGVSYDTQADEPSLGEVACGTCC